MVKSGYLIGACFLAGPADACRLALVLAMDVSSSVDATEYQLQREGLAAALVAPEVQAAFFLSPDPVALFVFEWSGRYNQSDVVGWTMINGPADLEIVSNIIATSGRSQYEFPTAIGYALGHAATRLADAPDCLFQTIDISGDGENNDGFGPAAAYAAFELDNVTVNGLAINAAEFEAETALVPYYRTHVLRGPGAFVEIANGFDDFAATMERKLIRELSAMILGQLGPVAIPEG